jgi:dynein light intermediate chain 1
VLHDGFDVEAINKAWSLDIEESYTAVLESNETDSHTEAAQSTNTHGGAVEVYEKSIRDPSRDALQATATENNDHKLEISSLDTQAFLATQLEILDKIRQAAEPSSMDSSRQIRGRIEGLSGGDEGDDHLSEARLNEHIGPVQFNMGGIQVDADDMLQRLKVCFIAFSRLTDEADNT